MPKRILISGISGFLGAHMAQALLAQGHQVYGLIRSSTDLWRCSSVKDEIQWINIDTPPWNEMLVQCHPQIIIHAAWIGVTATERDDLELQKQNVVFTQQLLDLAAKVKVEKFIALGSQAELGNIDGCVDENYPAHPNTAYGSVKLELLANTRDFCEQHGIQWIWLRIFSVFGPMENSDWLIPSLIQKMKSDGHTDMTLGAQRYAYLYCDDFKRIIQGVVALPVNSGVYNVSGKEALTLRTLAEKLKNLINPSFKINFGAIPYRAKQSMHIQGEISKLMNEIGEIQFTDINFALSKTISYYSDLKK